MAQRGWPRVDLVKLDVEGAELKALEGMRTVNAQNAQLRMIVELKLPRLRQANVEPPELVERVLEYGFTRFTVLETGSTLELPRQLPRLMGQLEGTA